MGVFIGHRNWVMAFLIAISILTFCSSCSKERAEEEVKAAFYTGRLSSSDETVRENAAYELANIGYNAQEVLPRLIQMADSDDSDTVRVAAVRAMHEIISSFDVPSGWAEVLLSAFEDDNPEVRAAAMDVYWSVRWRDEPRKPDYLRLIQDDNPEVRRTALSALCNKYEKDPPEDVVAAVLNGIADSDSRVRFTAASRLGSWGIHIEEAVRVLIESLDDPLLREQAMHGLQRIGMAANTATPYITAIARSKDTNPGMEEIVCSLGPDDNWAQVLREKKPGSMLLAEFDAQKPDCAEFVKNEEKRNPYVLFHWNNGREEKIYHWNQEKYHRPWAIDVLASIGKDQATIDLLFEALNDDDPQVRGSAAKGLASINPTSEEAATKIIEMLRNDPDELTRSEAASALGRIDASLSDIIVPALITALEDPSPYIPRSAAAALGRIGPSARSALPALNNILDAYNPEKDRYDRLQDAAADALVSIGPGSGDREAFLIGLLKHKNPEVRISALNTIVKEEPERALPYLSDGLRDSDSFVRNFTVLLLGYLSEQGVDVLEYLLQALNDEDPDVATSAAYRIRELGPEAIGALDDIISLLDSPDAVVSIADSMTHIYTMDKQYRTRALLGVLEEIGPEAGKAVPVLTKLLKQKDSDLVIRVLHVLPHLGDAASEAIPQMIKLLSDRKAEIREAAAYALGEFAPIAVDVDGVDTAVNNNGVDTAVDNDINPVDVDGVDTAVNNDGVGLEDAVPQLKKLLSDKNPGVRCKAATTLGLIGPAASDSVAALRQLAASDVNLIVRRSAREALERISSAGQP